MMTELLDDAQCRLVDCIDAHPGATAGELAVMLGSDPAHVRASIEVANRSLSPCARIAVERDGFKLLVDDEDAFVAWRRRFGGMLWPQIPETRQDRISFLVNDLLTRDDWVTVEALAKTLFCSRRTVAYDLTGVEEYLAHFDLTLERRPRYGVRVEGTEVKRRICLANNALDRLAEADELAEGSERGASGDGVVRHNFRLESIAACVDEAVERHGFTVNSVAYQNLLVHIAIAVARIRSGRYAAEDVIDVDRIKRDQAWEVAQEIAGNLSRAFTISVPEPEVAYLAVHLAGKRVQLPDSPSESAEGAAVSDEAWEVAGQMIAAADTAFSTGLGDDLELHMNLARHLGPLSVRLRYHMRLENPLLGDIRARYPFAFACALEAARVLFERYGSPVSDDEAGYLALAFALALERRRARQSRPKNIMIVCASGRGSARLLAMRCREEFGPQLGTIKTCDVSRVAGADFSQIDYVFTTVPLPVAVPVPVRAVGYFLDARDVAGVQELFHASERAAARASQWFDPRLFMPHLAATTRDEVIAALCERAESVMPLVGDVAGLVRQREESAPTSFGNLVAMPHPLVSVTGRTFVCAACLDEPVDWAGKPVRVALLVCVSDDPDEDLHDFYQAMLSFAGSASAVSRLLGDQRFETLLDVMGCVGTASDARGEVQA